MLKKIKATELEEGMVLKGLDGIWTGVPTARSTSRVLGRRLLRSLRARGDILVWIEVAEPPSSSEPGNPIRKENVVAYDDLKAGLQKRLGITDAEASDETLLAALDETLEEQADTTTPNASMPAGTVAI